MNSTYRSIWNEALGAWVATSEHTASRGKRAGGRVLVSAILLAGGFHTAGWAANECGVAAAGGTVNCAPGAYPAGIRYTVDDLTLNVNGASAVGTAVAPVLGLGVANVGAGAGTSTAATLGAVSIYTNGNYGYGLHAGATGTGNAIANASAGTYIQTNGTDGAKGIMAYAAGSGNATAINNGTVLTTGAAGLDGNFGVYALSQGGNASASNTGAVTTNGTFGYGVYAVTTGNGTATATSSGAITTNGPYSTGMGAHIDNVVSTMHGTAIATLQAGGTIATNGSPYGIGIFADVFGYGDAVATNDGAVATRGQFAHGAAARVLYGSGDATVVNRGTLSTTGIGAYGIYAATGQGAIGDANALNTGTVTTTGESSTGVLAQVETVTDTSTATATMSGGAVTVSGRFAEGVTATNFGLGAANASMTGGSIATAGENGFALQAHVANTASTAAATATMDGAASTITTQQVFGHGVYAQNTGSGAASATLLNGSISTLGETAHGVFAISNNTVPGSLGAATARMEGGSVSTAGVRGYGIYAENLGLGAASATLTGGAVRTTGDNGYGLYSLVNNTASAASTAAMMSGGTVTTDGLNGYGVYAATTGTGASTATLSAGDIVTLSDRSHGVVSVVNNFGSTAASTAAVTGGTITTGTVGSYGAYATTVGKGSANALMTAGAISTTGVESHGLAAAVLGGASTASASTVMSGGSIATSGSASHGLSSLTAGSGMAQVAMSAGNVAATGLNSDGLRATSAAGTYNVDVTGGNLVGGSGSGAAIHTLAAAGGTIDIGAAARVNGAASGIAIRDGDATGTGTDALGGNALVTTAGIVTGDAILGRGNDGLALTGGSFTGNIYGDDRVASAVDGNDSFSWTGGTLAGGFYGQNGSDTALVSAAGYNGSQVLNGGDDVSAADGWVDKLTLQGVTATAGGAQLVNWETINLENARLTLAGAPLVVGAGVDGSGAPMGLFVNTASSLLMGQPAFAITGDLHNAGLVDLRNPSGVPGNVLTVNGNYAGANGLVNINTALGNDASPTDKLVVNGNTSGTTRVQVNNTGGAGAPTVNGIQVVQVAGTSSAGNFTLASPVQAGAYEYGLHRGGRTDGDANSFYLSSVYVSPPPPPDPPIDPPPPPRPPDPPVMPPAPPPPPPEVFRPAVPGYVLGQVASNEVGLGLLGSLHKRVGEQQTAKWDYCGCDDKAPNDQVWGRVHAQRLDIDAKRQFGSEQDLQFVQFGKDLSIAYSGDPADKSRTHTGLSMGYGRTTTNFGDRRRGDAGMGYDTGTMRGQMATLGAYHTRYADNGSYLDLVGQLHAVHNKYTDKYHGEGTQKGAGLGLSVEVGRPWQIGDSQWLIEPQAQLSYQVTRYRGFSDDVSSVDGFTGQSLRARLGGRLAWNGKADRADQLTRTNTFYVTANLLHEFMDPEAVTIGGTSVSEDWAKKTWAEVGIGAQLPLGKSTYLYGGLQYQRSLGDRSREGVSGQVGVRVAW